jgi:DNA-binding transcriptional ArsR family regulator
MTAGLLFNKYLLIFIRMSEPAICAEVFRALADPTRRALFEQLNAREMSVSELTAGLSISQPAVSQHLAALRNAGLVSERREGRFAYYRADPKGLRPLVGWIDRYRTYWPKRIARLKTVLKEIDQ